MKMVIFHSYVKLPEGMLVKGYPMKNMTHVEWSWGPQRRWMQLGRWGVNGARQDMTEQR